MTTHKDRPHYSEGVLGDGAAILRDGVPMRVDEIVAALNANPVTPAAQTLSAKERYYKFTKDDEHGTPLENLRFFLSLALKPQDWIDVEPFLDALTTEPAAQTVAVPSNSHGVDAAYFHGKLSIVLRDLAMFKPDELARTLARLARTADDAVLREPEFKQTVAVPDGILAAVSEIEDAIARNQMPAAMVFTKMRALLSAPAQPAKVDDDVARDGFAIIASKEEVSALAEYHDLELEGMITTGAAPFDSYSRRAKELRAMLSAAQAQEGKP